MGRADSRRVVLKTVFCSIEAEVVKYNAEGFSGDIEGDENLYPVDGNMWITRDCLNKL